MNCGPYNANTKVHMDRWLPGLVVGCKPSGGGCSSLMSLTPLTGDPFFFLSQKYFSFLPFLTLSIYSCISLLPLPNFIEIQLTYSTIAR